jgi:hypothetical protein
MEENIYSKRDRTNIKFADSSDDDDAGGNSDSEDMSPIIEDVQGAPPSFDFVDTD